MDRGIWDGYERNSEELVEVRENKVRIWDGIADFVAEEDVGEILTLHLIVHAPHSSSPPSPSHLQSKTISLHSSYEDRFVSFISCRPQWSIFF